MRRNRITSRARQSSDADTLIKMARRLAESGSRLEDHLWERRLTELVNDRLARRSDDAIDAALDDLARSDQHAYDELADLAEACAESTLIEIDGKPYEALLMALPLLAWSRYRLPATTLAASTVDAVAAHVGAHLAAREARLAVADFLYSIDQLPEAFSDVRRLLEDLAKAAALRQHVHIDPKKLREPVAMLADTRYLLAAVLAPQGMPLYHWQEPGVDPDAKLPAMTAFQEQAGEALQPVMTGCRYRLLAPNAFHASLRNADRELRGFSLEAAVSYLKLAHELAPPSLAAAFGVFEDPKGAIGSEIRIGISPASDEDSVIEGVVWPLLGDDEEQGTEDIEKAIRALGIARIVAHPQRFPLEYCDDCGAPLFPNAAGHNVHAEAPEDAEERPATPLH
jgi:hypothetical protein